MDFDPRSFDDVRDVQRGFSSDARDLDRGDRGTSDQRDRSPSDPRDVFVNHVDLPREAERERIYLRERDYVELRGSESRTLAAVGAFRVVPAGDLRDGRDRPLSPREGDLYHLRQERLVQTMHVGGRDRAIVFLTDRGRAVLESSRRPDGGARQVFYSGLRKPRELTHDAQIYRAYVRTAERLRDQGARIRRVVLDYELKRDYQRFLQERNRRRRESDGRPDRTPEEIHVWAVDHHLPDHDGHLRFPDARIEYEDGAGRDRVEDIEVTTINYRGAHGASAASAGFRCYQGISVRIGGSGGASGGGRGSSPRVIGEVLS